MVLCQGDGDPGVYVPTAGLRAYRRVTRGSGLLGRVLLPQRRGLPGGRLLRRYEGERARAPAIAGGRAGEGRGDEVSDVFKKHQRRIAREDARIPDAILGVLYPNARSKN